MKLKLKTKIKIKLNVNQWVLLSSVEQEFTKTNKINDDNPQLYKNPKLES